MNFVMVVEKWQIKPEPKWVFHTERQVVSERMTPKRIFITEGLDKGKVFDRSTGAEIVSMDRRSTWYRHTLRDWEIERKEEAKK